jgi:hypothetical protein
MEYLADGLRMDIQNALVKVSGLFLLASGSATLSGRIARSRSDNSPGSRFSQFSGHAHLLARSPDAALQGIFSAERAGAPTGRHIPH